MGCYDISSVTPTFSTSWRWINKILTCSISHYSYGLWDVTASALSHPRSLLPGDGSIKSSHVQYHIIVMGCYGISSVTPTFSTSWRWINKILTCSMSHYSYGLWDVTTSALSHPRSLLPGDGSMQGMEIGNEHSYIKSAKPACYELILAFKVHY